MGYIYRWNSTWFAPLNKQYREFLHEDILLKKFIMKTLKDAAVDKVEVERSSGTVTLHISTAKPGVVIGRAGSGIEELKRRIKKEVVWTTKTVNINIKEVERAAFSAPIVAQDIISELERRVPFRRVMKQAIGRVQRAGALGVKVTVAGRLNGAEIARSETLFQGKIPLHTLRANIDYSQNIAHTIYGIIGVKVWIYKGEVFEKVK